MTFEAHLEQGVQGNLPKVTGSLWALVFTLLPAEAAPALSCSKPPLIVAAFAECRKAEACQSSWSVSGPGFLQKDEPRNSANWRKFMFLKHKSPPLLNSFSMRDLRRCKNIFLSLNLLSSPFFIFLYFGSSISVHQLHARSWSLHFKSFTPLKPSQRECKKVEACVWSH